MKAARARVCVCVCVCSRRVLEDDISKRLEIRTQKKKEKKPAGSNTKGEKQGKNKIGQTKKQKKKEELIKYYIPSPT